MNQKLPSMNVKIAKTVLTKKNAHVRRETNDYTFPKAFWKSYVGVADAGCLGEAPAG